MNLFDEAAKRAHRDAQFPIDLANARARFEADRTCVVAKNAASSAGIRAAARVPEAMSANSLDFDVEVTLEEKE